MMVKLCKLSCVKCAGILQNFIIIGFTEYLVKRKQQLPFFIENKIKSLISNIFLFNILILSDHN